MPDNSLSVRDRELFLAEPHIAALAVSAGPDRGLPTLPIWYQFGPGGERWVLTTVGSWKARLIEAGGRFTLMVERVTPTMRYVSVEGPVARTIPGTQEMLREMGHPLSAARAGHRIPGVRRGRSRRADRDLLASAAMADRRPRPGLTGLG